MKTIEPKFCTECKQKMTTCFNGTSFSIAYLCKNKECKKYSSAEIDEKGLIVSDKEKKTKNIIL